MTFFCKGLSLPALPHLGIYNREQYKILHNEVISNSIEEMPVKLQNQLLKIENESVNIAFLTTVHDGKDLDGFGDFAEINLLFQPYIFFDSDTGQKHECTVKAAVYLNDSEFIKVHINNHLSDSIAINPEDILKCDLFTCIHPEEGDMCLSPNNGRLKVSTYVPIHVFYTLILVPFNGIFAKALVTKHILIIQEINPEKFIEIENFLHGELTVEMIGDILGIFGGHEGWT